MLRKTLLPVLGLLAICGSLRADTFKAVGTVNSMDADKRILFVNAGGRDREVPIAGDAKILGVDGKLLADGVKSADLKRGATVTLTIEMVGGSPMIRELQLGRHDATPQAGGKKRPASGCRR